MGKITDENQNDIVLPALTPQAAILRLTSEASNIYNLNHILLVFKFSVYGSREKYIINIDILMDTLIEIKRKEKRVSLVINNKPETYNKKWCITGNILPVA